MSSHPHHPRPTHRKRVSALRLSSDTTSTLPEYITVGTWQRQQQEDDDILPSDRPPDYPDSAEEADEDTDSGSDAYVPPLPPSPPATSPRRQRRFAQQQLRRRQSSSTTSNNNNNNHTNDPYLDSLLARSVHALEMSNTLLQSSMSTQTTLSNIFSTDSFDDINLETSARGLSMRIRGTGTGTGGRSNWQHDLAEITRGVEGLFEEEEGNNTRTGLGISSSLPSASPPPQFYRQRRRPSLLELDNSYRPHLHLAPQDRSDLISPPPRALTQYIASSAADPDLISLPSTLGLRASSSSHSVTATTLDRRLVGEQQGSLGLHAPLCSPQLTDKPLEPSTPAYNMLASLVSRERPSSSGSSTPSTSITSITSPLLTSFLATSRRGSRAASTSTERGDTSRTTTQQKSSSSSPSPSSPKRRTNKSQSPDKTKSSAAQSALLLSTSHDRSPRSLTPKQILHSLPHRPMTPPTEESSSSSSSESCSTKQTILSLRKILDEQPAPSPAPPPPPPEPERIMRRPSAPAFLPRTPAPVAEAGTSTATASISRLFTKAKHSSSTRPPSPPRQSAMKQTSSHPSSPAFSKDTTPSPSPTVMSVPDLLLGVNNGHHNHSTASASSSGRSTPKRISFAELPESYSGSKPGGPSVRTRERKRRRGGVGGSGKGGGRGRGDDAANAIGGAGGGGGGGGGGGWWNGWLANMGNPSGGGVGFGSRSFEQAEDRLTRSWSGRMMTGGGFGSTLDEWAI